MKLHLPKTYKYAILTSAVVLISFNSSHAETIDVGYKTTDSASTVVRNTDLTINSGEKVGAWDKTTGAFITTYKYDQTYFSNLLDVNGEVTISGSGQLYLGGQYGSNYSGLLADTVTIDSTATGTIDNLNNLNLYTDRAVIGTLNMHAGAAKFHTQIYSGNSYPAGDATSYKQAVIHNINLYDGNLVIGSANSKADREGHYIPVLGGENANEKVYQAGGNMTVEGYTIAYNGLTIEQEKGNMLIRDKIAVTKNRVGGSSEGKLTIKQTGKDTDKTLSIGNIGTVGENYFYKVSSIKVDVSQTKDDQTGVRAAGTIKLRDSLASAVYTINQNGGVGTISIESGAIINASTVQSDTAAKLSIAGTLTVTDSLSFNIDTPDQTTAAIVMAGGDINVQNIANAEEFNLSAAVITDMMNDALAYTRETGEEQFTYTIDLVSGLNATDKGEFEALMASGKLEWSLELPTVYGGPIPMTELVDSGLQWSGNTLQIQTTWKSTPEPTTATLSILALAALATRRRRR